MEQVPTRGRQLKPQMTSFLEQTGEWLGRQADTLKSLPAFERKSGGSLDAACQSAHQAVTPKRSSQPALRGRTKDARRHRRVPVRLRSQFASKGRILAGEGELRDLSPWGCRVTSAVAVPVGTDLECCIFPQGDAHPFYIDGATVRWINAREFGLSFTSVRLGVQQQIAQLCRTQAA